MPLTMTIPDEVLRALPKGVVPDRHVMESVVLDLYRERSISAGKVAQLLGLSRIEADRLLSAHHLLESPGSAQCSQDSQMLEQMLAR